MQRHLLYLGEINSSQAAARRRAETDTGHAQMLVLLPDGRAEPVGPDASMALLRLSQFRWLAGLLWRELDRFWAERLARWRELFKRPDCPQMLIAWW